MASETASQPAALNASQPPWCFLLAAHLHFGAVEWWGPADMLRLRAVSRVLRSPWSTSDFITAVLSQGLGWTLPREDLAERDGVEGALRLRCAFCCRLYLERVLLHAIPNVAAAAAGVNPSTNSTPCVTIGGSFALHRLLIGQVGFSLNWEPDDMDVFVSFGCPRDSPAEELARSEAVLTAVQGLVSRLLPLLQDRCTEVLIRTPPGRDTYPGDEVGEPPIGDAFANMGMHEVDMLAGTGEASQHEEEEEEEEHRELVQARVWKNAETFHEPAQPKLPNSYTREQLLAVSTAEFSTIVDTFVGPMPMMTPFGTFTERGRLHWAHTHLRQLFAHGMLDGAPHDLLGRPKPYKIARCFDIEARHPTSSDGPGLRVEVQRDDGGWPFPRKVNIVQYHGEPLAPLDLVRGFDLLPPQVAVSVAPGSARAHFEVPPDATSAIEQRELRFGPYTFPTSYSGTSSIDLLRAAAVQVTRIAKYAERGFSLTKANGEVVEWV